MQFTSRFSNLTTKTKLDWQKPRNKDEIKQKRTSIAIDKAIASRQLLPLNKTSKKTHFIVTKHNDVNRKKELEASNKPKTIYLGDIQMKDSKNELTIVPRMRISKKEKNNNPHSTVVCIPIYDQIVTTPTSTHEKDLSKIFQKTNTSEQSDHSYFESHSQIESALKDVFSIKSNESKRNRNLDLPDKSDDMKIEREQIKKKRRSSSKKKRKTRTRSISTQFQNDIFAPKIRRLDFKSFLAGSDLSASLKSHREKNVSKNNSKDFSSKKSKKEERSATDKKEKEEKKEKKEKKEKEEINCNSNAKNDNPDTKSAPKEQCQVETQELLGLFQAALKIYLATKLDSSKGRIKPQTLDVISKNMMLSNMLQMKGQGLNNLTEDSESSCSCCSFEKARFF